MNTLGLRGATQAGATLLVGPSTADIGTTASSTITGTTSASVGAQVLEADAGVAVSAEVSSLNLTMEICNG